ncbi:MAG: hypothetical protein Q7R30_21605 [Acidobacteriota bacterium]|nr:hypothetical protein [Acidobacteriota bacterium]
MERKIRNARAFHPPIVPHCVLIANIAIASFLRNLPAALALQFRSLMDFAFFKDRYDYELLRREQLTAASALPVGILSVLGGAMVVMARSFSYHGVILAPAFGVLLAATGIAFFLCLFDQVRY